ncbi:MAG: AAA family ATPase, partial [Dehalococcoidia bacterium]|nr:AAA family ATPase [Dehalococcoidia bacterium]
LTLLTNLVTLRCYIFVIEEPELHLHPHMKRSLAEFIRRSSAMNQVFVITHDPIFIDPDFILNLNRFYSTGKKTGTLVASMSTSTGLSAQDIGQIKTASKDIIKRELYFARAVLFVEDESQQKFIEGCAEKLELGLDSLGISIIEVGGENAFKPYIRLAKQLDIPFLCLKDLPWGSSPDRPSNIYRSLDCELEQYLEQAGCGSLMEQARQAVGTSKQRVAKYCGENIAVPCIPVFFQQLLKDTVKLCKRHRKKK